MTPFIGGELTPKLEAGVVTGSNRCTAMAKAESDLPLGKTTEYVSNYTPSLLRSIERETYRSTLGIGEEPPFYGEDLWNCYELSWLGPEGKPEVAALRVQVPSTSPSIVESKSVKLYLNSFSQTEFQNRTEVLSAIDSDLGIAFRAPVLVSLLDVAAIESGGTQLPGQLLDELNCATDSYELDRSLLQGATDEVVTNEALHTHLFRTLCPVTGQPDWASVSVEYQGPRIDHEKLLRYLISYRCHCDFHEATIERIFVDLVQLCQCDRLTVHGRFLRRGGIDINPFRSTHEQQGPHLNLGRQ